MTTLLDLKFSISDKNYCQIVINIFQKYASNNFESKFFWESIKINFKN